MSSSNEAHKFLDHLDHLFDLPEDTYGLPTEAGSIEEIVPPVLSVSVAKNAWPVEQTYKLWLEASRQLDLARPSFNWESIVSFRREDPVILIHIDSSVQALMQLRDEYAVPCPLGARGALTYVNFLEVAPWNRKGFRERRFRGLGQLMLRFACQRSHQLGWAGRIALHALPGVEGFYSSVGFASPHCPNEYDEAYFELSPVVATNLMAEA